MFFLASHSFLRYPSYLDISGTRLDSHVFFFGEVGV